MPAVSEAVSMGPEQVLLWAALLLAAVALTVRAVDKQLVRRGIQDGTPAFASSAARLPQERGEPESAWDGVFWNAFGGLAVIVPAILIPSLASPAAGMLLLFLAAGTVPAALKGSRRLDAVLETRRQAKSSAQPGSAAARHEELLARWRQYELDPAKAIDFPAMSDVRAPQTALLIRAIKEAEGCRSSSWPEYAETVIRLETALVQAEKAAGVPQVGSF